MAKNNMNHSWYTETLSAVSLNGHKKAIFLTQKGNRVRKYMPKQTLLIVSNCSFLSDKGTHLKITNLLVTHL